MPEQKALSYAGFARKKGLVALVFSVCTLRSLESLVPTYLSSPARMEVGLGDIVADRFSSTLTMAGLFGIVLGGLLLDKVAHGNYRIIMMDGLSTIRFQQPTYMLGRISRDRLKIGGEDIEAMYVNDGQF